MPWALQHKKTFLEDFTLKKPFYKLVWFWVSMILILWSVILFVTLASSVGDNDELASKASSYSKSAKSYKNAVNAMLGVDSESGSDTDAGNDESSSDSEDSSHTGAMNEAMEFDSGEKVTVSKISDVDASTVYDLPAGEHAVAVTATVENTKSSPLDFNAQSFDLYDGEKVNGEFNAATYNGDIPNSIAAKMKATVTLYYTVKHPGPYSVAFGDYVWQQ